MLTYNFEKQSKQSLYEQLYRFIKADILNGKLKSGEKLPSKRALSENLKLSVITVESAYGQLIAEGYIYAIQKKGYFVSVIEIPETIKRTALVEKQNNAPTYFMDFVTNNISYDLFPFTVWTKILRNVILNEGTKLLQPMQYNGVYELRKSIASYLYHFRGIEVDAEQIIIGAGTEFLYNLIIQLIGQDKIYGVEDPSYTKITKIYNVNKVAYKHIKVTSDGLSIEELNKSDANVVHISPSHHFPTGIVMPIAKRQELLKWANENEERYIIEDDYDTEFRFVGKPIQSLISIDEKEKVIYINTFSKSLAPSIRISYMVLPNKLLEKYKTELGFYSCTVASFEQYTLAKFISDGYFEMHINRMKNLYRKKRDAVISAFLSSPFAKNITIEEENAGLHFLLRIKTNLTDDEMISLAKSKGILITCMSKFLSSPNPLYDHIIVVNYSGIDIKNLPEAIKRLAEIFA